MTSKPKLTRVELTFEDGTVQYLDGADAELWNEVSKSMGFNFWNHGGRCPKFPWKEKNTR